MTESNAGLCSRRASEDELVRAATTFLSRKGYRVRLEVPNMGQSIDVAATKNRWLWAVEAKVHFWSGAIAQCKAHELVADFICVAIATRRVAPRLAEHAALRGYGIIHYSQKARRCRWAVMPRRNRKVWSAQRKRLSRNLRGISYVT